MFTVVLMIMCRFQGTARTILYCPATNKKPRVAWKKKNRYDSRKMLFCIADYCQFADNLLFFLLLLIFSAVCIPDGLRMKISAQPCVSMGTNSARLGLSLRGGGADGVADVEDGGPTPSKVELEGGESGAANSPSDGDTRGLRLWAGPARRAWPPVTHKRGRSSSSFVSLFLTLNSGQFEIESTSDQQKKKMFK